MIIDLDPVIARKLRHLILEYGRYLDRRYGAVLPADLAALAEALPGGSVTLSVTRRLGKGRCLRPVPAGTGPASGAGRLR